MGPTNRRPCRVENFMNKKKIGIIVGGLCLLALAAVFIVKQQYESKVQKDIETFLATLPEPWSAKAEKIEVSFFDKSVTLTNLKGTYTFTLPLNGKQESMPMDFTFDRVKATGVNVEGFEPGAGTVKLLDSLDFTNTAFISPLAQSSIESYSIEGISADFRLVADEIAKAAPTIMAANAVSDYPASNAEMNKMMGAFAGIFKAYETVTIKRFSFKNYKYALDFQGQKIDMFMGGAEAKEYSIRKLGYCSVTDVKASLNGTPVFSMESSSSDEMILPSFVRMFEVMAKNEYPSPNDLLASLKGQTFALKNMRIKNMVVQSPLEPGKTVFSLADTSFSYVAEDSHALDFSFGGLAVDRSLIAMANGLPAAPFSTLPDPVTLEGALALDVTAQPDGLSGLNVKKLFVKGPGLGEANLVSESGNINIQSLMRGIPDTSVTQKNFELSVTDGGLSEVFFAVGGYMGGVSAEEARDAHVESLEEDLEDEDTKIGQEVLTALIEFLSKPGGTLKLVVAPPAPATIDDHLEAFTNELSLIHI